MQELFISESAFEKRFRRIAGTTPKKFAQIIRLQNIIGNLDKSLWYDNDIFYDQAHFIKEFKAFTGVTPKAFSEENNKNR